MLSRVFLLPAFGCLLTLTFFLNTQGIALASKTCVSQKQRALQDQQKQAARCFRSPLELRRVVPVKDAPKALHPAITLDNTFRQTYHASNLPSGQYKRLFKIAQKAYKK